MKNYIRLRNEDICIILKRIRDADLVRGTAGLTPGTRGVCQGPWGGGCPIQSPLEVICSGTPDRGLSPLAPQKISDEIPFILSFFVYVLLPHIPPLQGDPKAEIPGYARYEFFKYSECSFLKKFIAVRDILPFIPLKIPPFTSDTFISSWSPLSGAVLDIFFHESLQFLYHRCLSFLK